MAFADEVVKLQRKGRVHLRLTTAANPSVSELGDRRWGKFPDNRGSVPVKGTVLTFGTYSRGLTNTDQGFEVPSISVELIDLGAEWRKLAAEPWLIFNRWAFLSLRLEDDAGATVESDICWGQISGLRFPPGKVGFTISLLPGESLGRTIPRRLVSKDDWPNADPSAIGQPVPIHYGKLSNIEPSVLGLAAALTALTGTAPTGLTATPGSGGNGAADITVYYAICAVTGGVMTPLSSVVSADTTSTNKKVTLAWTAVSPTPDGIRVYRGNDANFFQFEKYRDALPYGDDDLPGSATGLVDNYPGISSAYQTQSEVQASPAPTSTTATVADGTGFAIGHQITIITAGAGYVRTLIANAANALQWNTATPVPVAGDLILGEFIDTHWDLQYLRVMQYYVSAMVGGSETKMSGPVTLTVSPQQPRVAHVTWSAYGGGTPPSFYKVRRKQGVYTYLPGWDREWTVASGTEFLDDPMTDATSVTIPASALQSPGGAVRGLFVDTNPAGTTGQFCYLFSGATLRDFLQVYVLKTASTATGGDPGSIDPPTDITAEVSQNPAGRVYTYAITSFNARGESRASEDVVVTDGPDPLNGDDYIHLTWGAVTGAEGYRIYRDTHDGDTHTVKALIKEVDATTLEYYDFGVDDIITDEHAPHHDQSSEAAAESKAAPEPEPILMTENVDYYVEVRVTNGNRYHIVRFVADHENAEVTANIEGYAVNADGTGALIENPADALFHFLQNWVFNNYRNESSWFADTAYMSGLIVASTFNAAADICDTRAYKVSGSLTTQAEARTVIQEWLTTFGFDWYMSPAGFGISLFEIPDPLVVDDLPQIDPNTSIFRETFEPSLDDRVFNKIPYRAGPTLDGGFFVSGEAINQPSIDAYDWTYVSEIIEARWTADAATAFDVFSRRVQRFGYNVPRAAFYVPLKGLTYPVTTLVAVTHWDGLAANTDGWVQRVCRVTRSDVDLDRLAIRVEVEDVSALIEASASRFGDRTWSAPDRSFTTAAPDKQARYLYLADRVTGQFSDGTPGKRLGLGPLGSGPSAWTDLSDFVLDQLATYQDMNEIVHNIIVVKEFPKIVALGGDYSAAYESTSYMAVQGAIITEMTGEGTQGATYEVTFMGEASSGDTVSIEWLNTTTGPAPLVTKTFTSTSLDRVVTATFALPTSSFRAIIRVKSTLGLPFRAYGFALVQR